MVLHIGGDVIIPTKDIIAILDLESTTEHDTRDFLRVAEEEGFIINIAPKDLPKSFIITETKDKKSKIYLSPISSATLEKRTGYIEHIHI